MAYQDSFSFRLEILRDELGRSQNRIENYDSLIFRIKGWAITLWLGTLWFALKENLPLLLFAAIPVLISFWLIETQYKRYQQRHIVRIRHIEKFLNATEDKEQPSLDKSFEDRSIKGFLVCDPIGVQTYENDQAFKNLFDKYVSFKRCFWLKSVKALYLSLIILSACAAIGIYVWT
jgi:hypothetical protein